MSAQQVIAIYHCLRNRETTKAKKPSRRNFAKPGYQFTIFDMLKED